MWDGVDNNLARKNLRLVKMGEVVLYYHTGKERAIVGEMQIVVGPMADPGSDDPKSVVVTVKPLRRWDRPVSLERIKQDASLAAWDLVRLPRLLVLTVSREQWQRVLELRLH